MRKIGLSLSTVRATSLICLLGLGLGLGSVLVYKIFSRIFGPQTASLYADNSSTFRRRRRRASCEGLDEYPRKRKSSDSGISTSSVMGNNASDQSTTVSPDGAFSSVLYNTKEGVRFLGHSESAEKSKYPRQRRRLKREERISQEEQEEGSEGKNLNRPLSIEISPQQYSGDKLRSVSSTSDDYTPGYHSGHTPGAESDGNESLQANYSPVSLYERNQQLLSTDSQVSDDSRSVPSSHSPSLSPGYPRSWRARSTSNSPQNKPTQDESSARGSRAGSVDSRPAELVSPAIERVLSQSGALKRASYSKHSYYSDFVNDLSDSPLEDLALRRTSSEFSESYSGIATPDSDMFDPGDVGLNTASNMQHIQSELKELEKEIESMSVGVLRLTSKKNLPTEELGFKSDAAKSSEFHKTLCVLRRHKTVDGSLSRSLSMSEEGDADTEEDSIASRHSVHHSGEYMWDYCSDLATDDASNGKFVEKKPTVDTVESSPAHSSRSDSPSFTLVRSHLEGSRNKEPRSPASSLYFSPNSSISDMYIDDDIRSLDSADNSIMEEPRTDLDQTLTEDTVNPDRQSSTSSQMGTSSVVQDNGNSFLENVQSNMKSPAKIPQNSLRNLAVGSRTDLSLYANSEWRGNTKAAETIRKGYQEIVNTHNFKYVRQIRGDNYCAIRAVLFQALSSNCSILEKIGTLESVLNRVKVFKERSHKYLQSWTFASRLPNPEGKTVYERVVDCVESFFHQVALIDNDGNEREDAVAKELNFSEDIDIQLMESVKVLMMLEAIDLHLANTKGMDIPAFAWLMYARDTSLSAEAFLRNHLNSVGDTGGLEQVEMYLLSYTLGISIKVYRPSRFGEEDFVASFTADTENPDLPTVHLIAEDDRHYNVLIR